MFKQMKRKEKKLSSRGRIYKEENKNITAVTDDIDNLHLLRILTI